MVYAPDRGEILLFGGMTYANGVNDLFSYEGTSWTPLAPAAPLPSGRFSYGYAYDTDRKVLVVNGGATGVGPFQGDTWEFDGTAWSLLVTADPVPSARASQMMAYDAHRKKVVLFGGGPDTGGQTQDTWEYDGTGWVEKTPSGAIPGARSGGVMFFDPVVKRVVLTGGSGAGVNTYRDVWEWDGTSWSDRTPGGRMPSSRSESMFAFNTDAKKGVLFGGRDTTGTLSDIWERSLDPAQAPAVIVRIDASALPEDLTRVKKLSIVARAGGTGFDGTGAPVNGGQLHIWNPVANQWLKLQENASPVGEPSPGLMSYTTASETEAQRLIKVPEKAFFVMVRPAAGLGSAPAAAKVDLDYVELTVTYRNL
jgi:hypothetical protein